MLRNINQPRIYNRTRLSVKKTIEQRHRGYNSQGKIQRKRRFDPTHSDDSIDIPFDFKRLHFSMQLAIAISMNKS